MAVGERHRQVHDQRGELDRHLLRSPSTSINTRSRSARRGRVWIGNDGGVWASASGGSTWLNKNGDLQITQFYPGAALDAHEYERAMAGAQDATAPRATTGPRVGDPRRRSATARRA